MKLECTLPFLAACYQAPDFDSQMPHDPVDLGDTMANVADQCHAALKGAPLNRGVIWQDPASSPHLFLVGDKLWMTDVFQTDWGPETIDRVSVYAGFSNTEHYCYAHVRPYIDDIHFEVNVDLTDPACGSYANLDAADGISLYLHHMNGILCSAYFTSPEDKASIYDYTLNVDFSDLDAASVIRKTE